MELKTIRVADAHESAFNPRGKKFEGPSFDELVESVKAKGVLVPVLARRKGKKYEIIAGARRFRAASIAKLAEIPANIVEMTDTEALEAQIIENLQRQDIHPLEEGAAYRKLLEETKGYDVATIAAKVGKSKPYIRQRLSLTELVPEAQKALRDGEMNMGQAVLIARAPAKIQQVAIKEGVRYDYDTNDIRKLIQEQTSAELAKNPPWGKGTEAEKAIAAAVGPCEECPKSADLFGENASLVCPNPACYARRMAAWITQKKKEYEAKGEPLSLVSSSYRGSVKGVLGANEYRKVALSERKGSDHVHMAIIVEGTDDVGKEIAICTAKNCKNKKHNPYYHEPYKPSAKEIEQRKKDEEKRKKDEEKAETKLVAAIEGISWPLKGEQLDVLYELATEEIYDDSAAVRLGLMKNEDDDADSGELLKKHVASLDDTGKIRVLLEVLLRNLWAGDRDGYIKKLTK